MNIWIACALGLMVLALMIGVSFLCYNINISCLAAKNRNRIKSGHRWTPQDMVDNYNRRESADLTLKLMIIINVLVVSGVLALYLIFH